jgi:DNA-binding phage protein
MEQLSDRDDAIDYLQVTLEEYQVDGDTSFFLSEIRTVVEAQGGVSKLAEKIGIEPQVLLDMLTNEIAPRLDMFSTILRTLGCQLSIESLSDTNCNEDHPVTPSVVVDANLEVATENKDPR